MSIVQDLKTFGKVDRRFWTGLEVEELSPLIARYFGLPNWHGVVVASVSRNSPAERAGLRENDGVVLPGLKFAQPRLHVAAQRCDTQAREACPDLALAS